MRIRLIGLAVGALGSLAFACSSSTPDPYATVAEYCAAYAQAVCQIGTTSCQFSVSACESYQSMQCSNAASQSMGAGTHRQYTPGNVQQCINALNGAYGNGPSTISASTLNSIDSTCALVFVGTAGSGAPCQTNGDCTVSGQICASAPGQSLQCATPTPRTLGGECADIGDECPAESYCQPQSGTSKCVAAATAGQACSAGTPTATSLPECDANSTCINGTCQALASNGGPCSTTSQCASGLFCDIYTDSVTTEPACVSAYTFARGAVDCLGIEGQSTNGTVPEAGAPEAGGMSEGGAGAETGAGDGGMSGG